MRSLSLVSACAVLLVAPALAGCASKNVPADRIVYAVHDGPAPPLPSGPTGPGGGAAPVQRADETKVREWWTAHRPEPGYIPAFDTAATEAAWQQAQCASSCGSWWPGIGLGINLGLGFGWGDCGSGFGISVGLPLGFYVW